MHTSAAAHIEVEIVLDLVIVVELDRENLSWTSNERFDREGRHLDPAQSGFILVEYNHH